MHILLQCKTTRIKYSLQRYFLFVFCFTILILSIQTISSFSETHLSSATCVSLHRTHLSTTFISPPPSPNWFLSPRSPKSYFSSFTFLSVPLHHCLGNPLYLSLSLSLARFYNFNGYLIWVIEFWNSLSIDWGTPFVCFDCLRYYIFWLIGERGGCGCGCWVV
jgi:hypothetical protein